MSKTLTLEIDGVPVGFSVQRLLVAGYTGRDAAKVRAHIEELERQGIPAPPSVPTLYPIDVSWVTTEHDVFLRPRSVSGEVEPMLLFPSDDLQEALVSVTSDFTDREEERRSIAHSKEQPKPLSTQVWRYREVAPFWDEIAMRSWVGRGADRQPYQSGTLGALLAPPDLLRRLEPAAGASWKGTVLLMGTLPLLTKEFVFSNSFAGELETPQHRKLSYECVLHPAARS
jgi:hypothetical protein